MTKRQIKSYAEGTLSFVRRFWAPLSLSLPGGWLIFSLGIPVGWMLGPLLVTAGHNLLFETPWRLPVSLRRGGELLLGATIGSLVTPAVVAFIAQNSVAALISVGGAVLAGLVCGGVLLRRSDLDLPTSFYATTVGGAAEMISLADLHGADGRLVAMYHSLRIGLVVFLVPLAATFFFAGAEEPARSATQWDLAHLAGDLAVLSVAAAGALLARRLKLPGGTLIGVLLAVAAFNLAASSLFAFEVPELPREFRYAAQFLIGASIGCGFDLASLRQIRSLLPLIFQGIALVIALSFLWALLLWWVTPFDLLTSFLSTAPAGSADMTAAALALGANAPVVAALQSLRLIGITVLMPWVIHRFIVRGR